MYQVKHQKSAAVCLSCVLVCIPIHQNTHGIVVKKRKNLLFGFVKSSTYLFMSVFSFDTGCSSGFLAFRPFEIFMLRRFCLDGGIPDFRFPIYLVFGTISSAKCCYRTYTYHTIYMIRG